MLKSNNDSKAWDVEDDMTKMRSFICSEYEQSTNTLLCCRSFGKFSVHADQKWTAVVRQCQEQLGLSAGTDITTTKVSKRYCPPFHQNIH